MRIRRWEKASAVTDNYYWRGYVDKTDGNYLVIFALPTILHEDTRYFAMGDGGFVKRGTYAASRIFITPNYHGHNTFNASEIFGRASHRRSRQLTIPARTEQQGKSRRNMPTPWEGTR